MIITIDNKKIEIIPELVSVFHQSINVFSANPFEKDKIPEHKEIKFNLKIYVEKKCWNIPYLVLLKKEIKDDFLEEYCDKYVKLSVRQGEDSLLYTYIPANLNIFTYSKERYLNKPYFEIFKDEFNEYIFKILNYIDTIIDSTSTKEEYEFIENSTFYNFNSQELENIELKERFVIREYRKEDIEFGSIEKFHNEYNVNQWQIPSLNYDEIESNLVKASGQSRIKEEDKIIFNKTGNVLIVLPYSYYSKYRPNFKEIKKYISEYNKYKKHIYFHFQGANIYSGTYQECLSLLNDSNALKNLRKKVFLERKKKDSYGRNDNYDNGDWGGLYGEEADLGRWNTD